MKRILFVNHQEEKCGVFQFGDIIGKALLDYSKECYWAYARTTSSELYWDELERKSYDAVIFNYHPGASSLAYWVVEKTTVPTFGIVHEESWFDSDSFLKKFDHLIVPDPTCRRDDVFITNRTIPDFVPIGLKTNDEKLTIGSFGFGFGGKGYEKIIDQVQFEFDEAIIRLHIPFAAFGDASGHNAKYIVDDCKNRLVKPNIQLETSHGFLDQDDMIDWLSENTVNCFFYDTYPGRGISSAIDFALAAKRPIAISNSNMFRHIPLSTPIRIEDHSLTEIIKNGITPLEPFYQWTERNTVTEYETIMKKVLA